MNTIYRFTEIAFERLTSTASAILGNSITFIIAFATIIYWLSNPRFFSQDIHAQIGDIVLGITFLYLFIIQKSNNRHSASLHLKLNELISSHKPASNSVMNAEAKTEHEINELSKEYSDLADQVREIKKEIN